MKEEPAASAEQKKATEQPVGKVVDGQPTVFIKVYSPFKVYFEGPAFSISAENDTGPFDILPQHHNFMTLLNACDLVISAPGGGKTIKITRGVMHVKADNITVFLDV